MKKYIVGCGLFLFSLNVFAQNVPSQFIQHKFKPGEILSHVEQAIKKARSQFDKIVSIPNTLRNFDNTMRAMETAMAEFCEETNPTLFLKDVLVDDASRHAASQAEQTIRKFKAEVFLRKDLFGAFEEFKRTLKGNFLGLDLEDQRLISVWELKFKKSGVRLKGEEFNTVCRLKSELIELEAEFLKNINNNIDSIEISEEELEGLPQSFRNRIQSHVSTQLFEYVPFMENAVSKVARKRLYEARRNREASKNIPLLKRAQNIKLQIARLLGYESWVAYQTDGLMAQNPTRVQAFLSAAQSRLEGWNQEFYEMLLAIKREDEPNAQTIEPWEQDRLLRQVFERKFHFYPQTVQEYFQQERVVEGAFRVCSQLFGIEFRELQEGGMWANGVKHYEVRDTVTQHHLGYFYTDLYAREGKFQYAEAEAPEIIKGRVLADGTYQHPVVALVMNLAEPQKNMPSLLSLDDVQTFFHEFGHVLHEIMTEAKYASFSGMTVDMDFLETPSQLFEYFLLDPSVLDEISEHFISGQKMPEKLKSTLIEAYRFQMHVYEMQLLFLSLFDFNVHSEKLPDVQDLYVELHEQILHVPDVIGKNFPASFGYLMDPMYSGTFYTYLLDRVIAKDMAEHFSPDFARRFRDIVFRQGGAKPAPELIRAVLGREVSQNPFFRDLNSLYRVKISDAKLKEVSERLAVRYGESFDLDTCREMVRTEFRDATFIEKCLDRDFVEELKRISPKDSVRKIADCFFRQLRKVSKSR